MSQYKGKNAEAFADELGAAYTAAKSEEKAAKSKADEAAISIKDMAAQVGTPVGKAVLIRGQRFEVGYSQPDASPSIDEEKLRKMVTPAIWKQIVTEVVDSKKFVALVETGKITAKTAQAVMVPGTPPTPRVVVKAI